jgi:hypothetical protein
MLLAAITTDCSRHGFEVPPGETSFSRFADPKAPQKNAIRFE